MAAGVERQYVRTLFDSIAHRYDLLNHLLSGGFDISWRRKAISRLEEIHPRRILDVATGTADFAIAALRLGPEKVVGVDIASKMLERGREKVEKKGFQGQIELHTGAAEQLRFPDASFDASIVAFGVRNFEDVERGLREMHRVVRPGGKIVVLEFSRPRHFPFKQLYFAYFLHVLPRIGRAVSRSRNAYRYLPETVMAFPEGEAFVSLLRSVGFEQVREERLTAGIVTVYSGIRTLQPREGYHGTPSTADSGQ